MIYLNNASTTKPDKEVLDDFMWCAENCWYNPSDIDAYGLDTKYIVQNAQKQIAVSINANWKEIVFTSGGSESNNWAIKGYLDRYQGVKTIITTEIEHPSVYNTCLYLKDKGYNVVYTPLNYFTNEVDVKRLEDLIADNVLLFPLVSIMMANNEIGTINNIKEISKIVHRYGGILHVDAVQAYMHTKIDVKELGIDMMSTSFHKINGLKGIGFLYVKDGIELSPLIHGGKQFNYRRSGTENVPAIYAFGKQVVKKMFELENDIVTTTASREYMYNKICAECKGVCEVYLNGHKENRLPGNLSLTFDGIDADRLIALLEIDGFVVSAGSACCSGEKTPSRVLKAIGLSDEEAFNTIRISIDKNITKKEIDSFVDALVRCIKSLKEFGLD